MCMISRFLYPFVRRNKITVFQLSLRSIFSAFLEYRRESNGCFDCFVAKYLFSVTQSFRFVNLQVVSLP